MNFNGDNLETVDKPTGEINNSAIVNIKYNRIIHNILTLLDPLFIELAGIAKTANPIPKINNPKLILTGVDKVKFFSFNLFHNIINIGAKITINKGLTDWNHSVGTRNPPTEREIKTSVKKVNETPACSYAEKKKIAKKEK